MEREQFINELLLNLAEGKIQPQEAFPVLKKVFSPDKGAGSVSKLIDMLEPYHELEFEILKKRLKQSRLQTALRIYEQRLKSKPIPDEFKRDLEGFPLEIPLGWRTRDQVVENFQSTLSLLKDWLFVSPFKDNAPKIAGLLEEKLQLAIKSLNQHPSLWSVLPLNEAINSLEAEFSKTTSGCEVFFKEVKKNVEEISLEKAKQTEKTLDKWDGIIPNDADEIAILENLKKKFNEAVSEKVKTSLLDIVCSWPTNTATSYIMDFCALPWAQERASLLLTLRFGTANLGNWYAWKVWLEQSNKKILPLKNLIQQYSREFIFLWGLANKEKVSASFMEQFQKLYISNLDSTTAEDFICRWGKQILPHELNELSRQREKVNSIEEEKEQDGDEPLKIIREKASLASSAEKETKVHDKLEREKPSLWDAHFKPFIIENWYLVIGLLMITFGSSILAYYTWEKSWLLRYSIMPSILAFFTISLAETGKWLEKKDSSLKTTAFMLTGTAISLLPLNFMTVALVSVDQQVRFVNLVVPLMCIGYTFIFGSFVKRWCTFIHQSLTFLGATVLFLNSLIFIRPLNLALFYLPSYFSKYFIIGGFYAGFLVVSLSVFSFAWKKMNLEMAINRRISWFFGLMLFVTFFEVFVWIHVWLKNVPVLFLYAPMIVMGGGLILLVERRIIELQKEKVYSSESFIGFAMIFLGILLGFSDPYTRILNFLVAGIIWIYQAFPRDYSKDYWIGWSMLASGLASIGALNFFPAVLQPFIGIVLVSFTSAGSYLFRNSFSWKKVCMDFQSAVLFLMTVVSIFSWWHFQYNSRFTLGYLLITVVMFFWRALKDKSEKSVYVAMIILALALPFMGCVDLANKTLHGNTMVFGISVLSLSWLILLKMYPHPLFINTRSTVLFLFGLLALPSMFLRVIIERDITHNALWYLQWMDYSGPLLMTLVLILTAYYSRSLIPSSIAAVIFIILLPELKNDLKITFPGISFGSGMGSSVSALGLVMLSFFLRDMNFLKRLNQGDRFFNRENFPITIKDHRLFTWPIMASVFFLLIKVDTWMIIKNYPCGISTAAALFITGMSWMLVSIYFRTDTFAVSCVHLGWMYLLIGLCFGHFAASSSPKWHLPFLILGLMLQIFSWISHVLKRRYPWIQQLFSVTFETVLKKGSVLFSVICLLNILKGGNSFDFLWIQLFLAIQLTFFSLTNRTYRYSTLLFMLIYFNLLAYVSSSGRPLFLQLSIAKSLNPTLLMIAVIQAIFLILEFFPKTYAKLSFLLRPFLYAGTFIVVYITALSFMYLKIPSVSLSLFQTTSICILLIVFARIHSSPFFLLLGFLTGYVLIHYNSLAGLDYFDEKIDLLLRPWKLSLLSFSLVFASIILRFLNKAYPAAINGRFPILTFKGRLNSWMHLPAGIITCLSMLLPIRSAVIRASAMELMAPYINCINLGIIGSINSSILILVMSLVFLAFGNIQAVYFFLKNTLILKGLSELHLISLGLSLTLLEMILLKKIIRKETIIVCINRICLGFAFLILVLLSMNYGFDPALTGITHTRFILSGVMALLAAFYFRSVARKPDHGEERYLSLCEGIFHFGVSIFIWCLALMIPFFRKPQIALFVFWLPGIYFYLKSEIANFSQSSSCSRYRNSAKIIGFGILGLYVFKAVFNMIFYPEFPIHFEYYHYNSIYIILLGLVLIRLHGLGETDWLAFYGGLAILTGSYFAVTWFPGWSPFTHPVEGAWTAILIGHFWILATSKKSPIKMAFESIGNISPVTWLSLRHSCGRILSIAVHVFILNAIFDSKIDSYMIAPLLTGGFSVLLHQAVLNRSKAFYAFAGFEMFLALHSGFVFPGYLQKEHVIWVILFVWILYLIIIEFLRCRNDIRKTGKATLFFFLLSFMHVLYHGPVSVSGLAAFAISGFFAAITPVNNRIPEARNGYAGSLALFLVPLWLVFFGNITLNTDISLYEPLLATVLTGYLISALGVFFQASGSELYRNINRPVPRLLDHFLFWISINGTKLFSFFLLFTSIAAIMIQLFHYNFAFTKNEIILLSLIYILLIPGWYHNGKVSGKSYPYVFFQLCFFCLFTTIRKQLLLTTGFWNLEYDIWASMAASACLAGTKSALNLRLPNAGKPFSLSLLFLPAFAVFWVIVKDLGTDIALLVTGTYSVMFSYMAKDDRESPYNILAVGGFAVFIILVLWNKFHIHVIHSFTIPTGTGVLILVQLYSNRIRQEVKNFIRGITLLAMFATSGYSALVDDRYPLFFNMTFLLLGFIAMLLGTILRIRLFFFLGIAAVITDLTSIFVKAIYHMGRNEQMTIIGVFILLFGAALITGTIYYKTHRESVNYVFGKWVNHLAEWE